MQSLISISKGRKKLNEIIDSYPPESQYWNEAQNRFQFIDRLLIECLGWDRQNINVEERDELGGIADYVFYDPAIAVLEAKKESIIFEELPLVGPKQAHDLKSYLELSKNLKNATDQVISYCAKRGAQLAIICNGPQLIIFQAITIGQSPLDGDCFFFNGFNSYISNFSLLWSFLSPEGIFQNKAQRELALHKNPKIPQKSTAFLLNPYKERYRNDFQESMRNLSSLLLEEIEDNPDLKSDFYNECYVPLNANNRHLMLSKKVISERYRRVGEKNIAPKDLNLVTGVENGNINLKAPELNQAVSSKPFVVLGDVGVGKSSFFENLYEELDVSEKGNTYFIKLDLGTRAALAIDLKKFILREIPEILKKNYNLDIDKAEFVESIYYSEINDFEKSVSGKLKKIDRVLFEKEKIEFLNNKINDRDAHLHASLAHLSYGRDKKIVLVIDNADQRSFNTQQSAFLIAQELAATRNIMVFVALRPSTFYDSKNSGALSGYQNKVFSISPAPADEVIRRRLTFATRIAEGKIHPVFREKIRLELGNVVSFLQATLRSIKNNEAIKKFLSNITGGNTRSVIELITGFFGSPNVDSKKIVEIESKTGRYFVPLHEFTKHALLGDYAYFNDQSSMVASNVYDINFADPREHFLKPLLIAYLGSNLGITNSDGFVEGKNIFSEMMEQRFLKHQIDQALRQMAEKRLIETPYSHYREIMVEQETEASKFQFRATTIGLYHLRSWICDFSFLDAVSIDTPIFTEEYRMKVNGLAESFKIQERYNKTLCFRKYLEEEWNKGDFSSSYFNFTSLIKEQNESFERISKVIERLN